MLRKAAEIHYHTEEQVEGVITQALAQAARDDVPEALREAVFVQACGLLAQKHVQMEQVGIALGGHPNGLRA